MNVTWPLSILPSEVVVVRLPPSGSVQAKIPTVTESAMVSVTVVSPGQVTLGAELTITVTVTVELFVAPHASVATSVITFAPTTGVKQTVPLEYVPPVAVIVARLPSASLALNPERHISLRSHTKMLVSFGVVAMGSELRLIVTVTVELLVAPHESVAVSVITFAPTTGVKQTVPLEYVAPVALIVARLPSASLALNPERHISLRSHTNILVSFGVVAMGSEFRLIVTVTVELLVAPHESVAVRVITLAPSTGVKQTVPAE